MSISGTYTPLVYNGDDLTVAFPYNFLIFEDSEIVVTETIIATGVETVKTLTTHYTVSGEGTGSGTVTAVTAPASTVRWTIGRSVARTQLMDLVENDALPAETLEDAFDKLTMIVQEVDNNVLRSLRQPTGDEDDIAELPSKIDRASLYLAFDTNGDPVATAGTTSDIVTTPFTETLLDDSSAAAFRTTLDVPSNAEAILDTIIDAKGDLIVGTASDTPAKLTVGSNGSIPMARSADAKGLAYVAALNKYIYGMTWSNNAGDATNDIDLAAGGCMDATGAYWMTASALTKRSDANWAVGTNQGWLDTGAIGNNEYYAWTIARSDTGVVDSLLSLSSTAPTMPANYDFKRLTGYILRSGGAIVAFHTYEFAGGGIDFRWDTPAADFTLSATLTTSRRTDAIRVPLTFSVLALIRLQVVDAGTTTYNYVVCPDETDSAPSSTALNVQTIISYGEVGDRYVRTSATGTIAARSDTATVDTYRVSTVGFIWSRRN